MIKIIPDTNSLYLDEVDEVSSSKTYKMFYSDEKIIGNTDELEAIKQAIFKILNTERYSCEIYSWDYGVEFYDLFGRPVSYVCSEIKSRIKEALLQDDRILDVSTFSFNTDYRGIVKTNFVVHTILGDIDFLKEVSY